ncbi:MAG: hypothetical protein ACJAS4_003849 [Bacteriovoracaceae bacterium]|jgi:mercuric ion transport protein|tara:strand:- start:279 stop:965 length:687 start_codon:yes stop_codon:yes gene_type:complete
MLSVEFIFDKDCPNVKDARANLMKAFSKSNLNANWKEWDRNSNKSPDYARKYGSPTILVNGKDIADVIPDSEANCCRLYDGGGIPSVQLISDKLLVKKNEGNKLFGFLGTFSIGPGMGAALLAKASCPLCYPAIAGFLTSIGLGFLFKGTYFYILMSVFFLVALVGIGYRATERRGYGPLALGMVSSVIAISGHYFENQTIFYVGIGLLVASSIWNLIPKKENCNNCN